MGFGLSIKKLFDLIKSISLPLCGFVFVLLIHGVIPFFGTPTLGQAVWLMGFAESFALDDTVGIYATSFGYPTKMPIAFGLPAAYPAAYLSTLGFRAPDAYSIVFSIWFLLAYLGAIGFARYLGVRKALSIFSACLWLCMPITWGHSGYSALSLSLSLLPFYFFLAIKLFTSPSIDSLKRYAWLISYVLTCSVALFMDGYGFMMFALGASILWLYIFLRNKALQDYLVCVALPVHILSFGLAYGLYATYIGMPSYETSSLDFFRAWGVDITFLVMPTEGVHWFFDVIGASIARSSSEFFGDASVWRTTFMLPLLLVGIFSWFSIRRKDWLASGFLLIALVGLYLSLGPSIKFDSVKPEGYTGALMFDDMAVLPAGTEIISENVPGFKDMRAAYRWSALAFFGLWALLALYLSKCKLSRYSSVMNFSIVCSLIIIYIPNPSQQLSSSVNNRNGFHGIHSDFITPLKNDLNKNEVVAFLPYRNDFLINYAASILDIRTFNVGGDKNLKLASQNWPKVMSDFKMGQVDAKFFQRVQYQLLTGETDAVVLPYIDLLWGAHKWPALPKYKGQLAHVVNSLKEIDVFLLTERPLYSVIRLSEKYRDNDKVIEVLKKIKADNCFYNNVCIKYSHLTSDQVKTKVGIYDNGRIKSDYRSGFLMYGPYVALEEGSYHLTVMGKARHVVGARIDVVSSKGTVVHAEFSLDEYLPSPDVLFDGKIYVPEEITDLEVRLYVQDDNDIQLNGYDLIRESQGSIN